MYNTTRITSIMYISVMSVSFFFLFLFPEVWIKVVIAGAGALTLQPCWKGHNDQREISFPRAESFLGFLLPEKINSC